MKIYKTKFKDLKIIQSKTYFDKRGEFKEVFKENLLKKKFVFTCYSKSKKNVLRGLHLQTQRPQAKYISVLKGKILDVVVDLRKKSKTYKRIFKTILSSKNNKSIFVPEGFAHGFLALDNENIIVYHLTKYRHIKSEVGILWNDKILNIDWNIKNPILSKKDRYKNLSFSKFEKKFQK